MAGYEAYLEVADDGRTMAHVLNLPGCNLRRATRESVLEDLPAAIGAYHAWMRRHGEASPPDDEPVEIKVVGEVMGQGPFDPGDRAALFPPDREPISPEEMERYYRLMAYNRRDLLALVGQPSDELLDWRPYPGAYNLRRVLRHIGNGKQWYVSRIVPVETLPPEWEDDEGMPPFDYLEMSRRTAIERLRRLTAEERAGVFYPTVWTEHPDEPWTARKVLRRALEHEQEHTGQAREILAAHRRWLLARLAAERAGLISSLLGLGEATLTAHLVTGEWTVKDLLAHSAAWERWEERNMRAIVLGEAPVLAATEDADKMNAAFVDAWRERSLDEVLDELREARGGWVCWLESLPEEVFCAPYSFGGHDWLFPDLLQLYWDHDAEHAAQIRAWREAEGLRSESGNKAILVASLEAARAELLSSAALVPDEGRDLWPVCGEWTPKDVLGHVADWERFAAEGLRMMAAGEEPQVEPIKDIDAWNRDHAEARREQPWDEVWDDLSRTRRTLMEVLRGMDEEQLAPRFPFPWGVEGTPYDWLGVFVGHDREHARDFNLGGGD